MIEEIRVREFVGGVILAITSWEAWDNILISLFVALAGGFMAAAGKQMHKRLFDWRQRNIERRNRKNKNNENNHD